MRQSVLSAFAIASLVGTASAQPELCLLITPTGNGNQWSFVAELLRPTGTIRATIADLGFTLEGEGFSNFNYNSAFDSTFFGPASVSVTSTTIEFAGTNTIPPLNNPGGPDSSNPLLIATFNADTVHSFRLNGQVTGAYVGIPFDQVFFYQRADGSAGDVPYSNCFPSPGSASLLGFAGIAAMRRRR